MLSVYRWTCRRREVAVVATWESAGQEQVEWEGCQLHGIEVWGALQARNQNNVANTLTWT